jgi:hypothetical protein
MLKHDMHMSACVALKTGFHVQHDMYMQTGAGSNSSDPQLGLLP